MVKRAELFEKCVETLTDKGFRDDCAYEVTWVFQDVLGEKNIHLNSENTVSEEQEKRILDIITRRSEGYPLQYLLGVWEFYGLPFKVGEGVLIPRQDTETLVDIVLKKFKDGENLTVADLCSGSGCIGVAVEKNLDVKKLVCVEKSDKALRFLGENIKLNYSNAEILQGDVLDEKLCEIVPMCDIITCNPPYLTDEDMKDLQKEVSFEPKEALYGGEDGLDFYRTVTRIWKDKLNVGGMLIFEIGINQEDDVMLLLVRHGFENVRCRHDLCGINRCVFGFKKEK